MNGDVPTPRVNFITDLLDKNGINYELDVFSGKSFLGGENNCYNIIMKGDSDKMVVAHHDIVNPNIDNANDNSASVINAISLKMIRPDINVVILDGEEVGGLGSQRVSDQINDGYFGDIDWVLNLELSGKGGEYFFIGDYPGKLSEHILSIFDCPVSSTPYNDSVTFRKNGIDSVVINPLPPVLEGKSNISYRGEFLDYKILYRCHGKEDTIDNIDIVDMKNFVDKVLLKIV